MGAQGFSGADVSLQGEGVPLLKGRSADRAGDSLIELLWGLAHRASLAASGKGIHGRAGRLAEMEWPTAFYEWKSGKGCPACEQGRPEETDDGVRFFAGEVVDAYLRRSDIQRGLTVAIWRGHHVVEPTELTEEETSSYWRELRLIAAAIEEVMRPVKIELQPARQQGAAPTCPHRSSVCG